MTTTLDISLPPTFTPQPVSVLAQGALISETGVRYCLWAPQVERLEVEIYAGGKVVRRLAMERDKAAFHLVHDPEGRAGDLYKYRLDGGDSFPDPASRFQPEGVHGPSMVVDLRTSAPRAEGYVRPLFRDLVIYELHVGTFTPEGTFRAALDRLPYVRDMGVTAIELMPIGDFPGERNWGYDGVLLYAPARAYGQPEDLRALVNGAHALGLGVLLDVVYNHFGPAGNYLSAYVGDYLDEGAKTPWGGAIRYGSPEFWPLRQMVVENPEYWMEEFRIDGFRFDATHEIVDGSERHILAEMTDRVHARGGYVIAEDCRNERRLMRATADGGLGFDGVWADDFHHTTRVAITGERESYFGDFTGELRELTATLRQGWYYCGQHSTFSGAPRGTPSDELLPGSCICCISNHDQTGNRAFGERLSHLISLDAYLAASALLCLTPHTPLLFMGQEWGASTPFLFFTDHDEELGRLVTEGRRKEFKDFAAFSSGEGIASIPDPQAEQTFASSRLKWDELEQAPHRGVAELYRVCLALRHENAAFRPSSPTQWWAHAMDCGVGALGFIDGGTQWVLLLDLVGGHGGSLDVLPVTPSTEEWQCVFSTWETRFGGNGQSPLGERFDAVHFDRPGAVLLHRKTA